MFTRRDVLITSAPAFPLSGVPGTKPEPGVQSEQPINATISRSLSRRARA